MSKPNKSATLKTKSIALHIGLLHPDNPREHPEKGTPEWDALKASLLAEYFDPLVFNKRNGHLVSGHYRLKILLDEGYTRADMVVVDWDEPTHIARLLAANRHGGVDDDAKMRELLRGLGKEETALTGMTEAEIAELLKTAEPPQAFPVVDENLPIQHVCPKCRYSWSGSPS